jgi:hypothetical protein
MKRWKIEHLDLCRHTRCGPRFEEGAPRRFDASWRIAARQSHNHHWVIQDPAFTEIPIMVGMKYWLGRICLANSWRATASVLAEVRFVFHRVPTKQFVQSACSNLFISHVAPTRAYFISSWPIRLYMEFSLAASDLFGTARIQAVR